jgi:hypothetical protein
VVISAGWMVVNKANMRQNDERKHLVFAEVEKLIAATKGSRN